MTRILGVEQRPPEDVGAAPTGDEKVLVRNPRTGQVDYRFAPVTAAELDLLAAKLRASQPSWRDLGVDARADVMRRWADSIEASVPEIADAEVQDTGRRRVPYQMASAVVASIRHWCDRAASVEASALPAGVSSVTPDVVYASQLEPYPLVGVISPWNNPFLLSTLDAVPALLAGSAVIIKPSEITPRFVDPVMKTVRSVPELAEVLCFVKGGAQAGQALVGVVDALCFTGSVPTGRQLASACAQRFIPAFLELGGKDAAIVTATADLGRATDAVLKGAVYNTGQMCFGTERVYVDQRIFTPFVELLAEKASSVRLNYPDIEQGDIGPFITPGQADIVDGHLEDAIDKGATLVCGGPSLELGGGRYMPATVLIGVDRNMLVMSDETFGPVIPVVPYEDDDHAVDMANDSSYGLSAAVIAGSAHEAQQLALRLHAGAISLQDTSLTPYIMGDVEKTSFGMSGLGGSRMGANAMLRFSRKKAIITRLSQADTIASSAEDGWTG